MNYRIEAPEGVWAKKIVESHLGGDAYLTVTLTQANLTEPIVVEAAALVRRSLAENHRVLVPLRNVEVIDRRNQKKDRQAFHSDLYRKTDYSD